MEGAAQAKEPQGCGRGGRGGRLKEQIVENKKDDMKEYMEQASALIHKYVPPQPEDIQKAKARLKVDTSTPRLSVAPYLDKKEDAVTLAVKMAALPDGTSYTTETTLEAKAKNIRVVIQNSGHRSVGK